MKIKFRATQNKDYVMINTITFRLKNGKCVTIDRESTQYESYKLCGIVNLTMVWEGCYFWDDEHNDPDNPAYITEKDVAEIAELVSVNIEDEADDDYEVNIISWA